MEETLEERVTSAFSAHRNTELEYKAARAAYDAAFLACRDHPLYDAPYSVRHSKENETAFAAFKALGVAQDEAEIALGNSWFKLEKAKTELETAYLASTQ